MIHDVCLILSYILKYNKRDFRNEFTAGTFSQSHTDYIYCFISLQA